MREQVWRSALLPGMFFLAALPVLIFLALFVPTGEVPDEVAHILRADSVRHGEIAGFRRPRLDDQGDPAIDAAVRADTGLLAAGLEFTPGSPLGAKHETLDLLDHMRSLAWTNRLDPVSIPNTAVYPPLFYLPSAAAIGLAKHWGYGPYDAIKAARLMNLAVYLALGAAALLLAEYGRIILLAILCLPMSLWLAASVSHDGIVIACSALAGSLLCHSGQTWKRWIAGAIALALAAMAKPFLLPMALLVFVTVPGGVRQNRRAALSGFALAVLPAIIWAAAMASFVAAPFVRGPARPGGPLWSGPAGTMFPTTNPGEQLHILFASPDRLVMLPINSAWDKGIWLWREMLGVLGALDVPLSGFLYDAWGWALAAALLAGLVAGRSRPKPNWKSGWLQLGAAVAGAAASIWMTYLIQYLNWTRVGESLIDGVQGRYFIPIAALATPFAALPLLRIPAGRSIAGALSLPVILLALSGIATLTSIVITAYYMR